MRNCIQNRRKTVFGNNNKRSPHFHRFPLAETRFQLKETSYPLSAEGNLLSASGNLLSANGNLLSANGSLLPADGNLLSGAFRSGKLETCFQLLSGQGKWKLSAARPHSISLHSGSILVKSKSSLRMDFNFKYTSTSLISNKLRYPPRKRRRRRASFLKFLSKRSTTALPCSRFFTR